MPIVLVSAQSEIPTTTTREELVNALTEELTNRETSFVINYIGDDASLINSAYISSIFKDAYSVNDYLRWSWTYISASTSATDSNVKLTFTCTYLTTKAQEDYVNEQVSSILPTILAGKTTDKQKALSIHDYIVENVTYDHSLIKRTAYTALYDKSTVCQGYSLLYYKMLQEAGIQNKIVDGYINSGFDYHSWNLVNLDGNWYHVDTTNDAALSDKHGLYMLTDTELAAQGFSWNTTNFPEATVEFAPAIMIGKYIAEPTNQDIMVTATTDIGTLNALSHTFTENGEFNFIATDTLGNLTTETVNITNIDKVAPVITIGDYSTDETDQNVVVAATTEDGTMNESSHVFTTNGSFVFIATDDAGNITEKTVTVNSIVKPIPLPTVEEVKVALATSLIITAENKMSPVTIAKAQKSIDSLADPKVNAALQKRLDTLVEKIEVTAGNALTKAEKSKSVSSIKEAQSAISNIANEKKKIDLQKELEKVIAVVDKKNITTATKAVDLVEKKRLLANIIKAQKAIDNMIDSTQKQELQKDLEKVIKIVDKTNIANAIKAIDKASTKSYVSKSTYYVDQAQKAIDKMIDSSQKDALQKQLGKVLAKINKKK